MCGVSNAAPYTYFKKKSDLLYAMSDYIWGILATELDKTRKKYENQSDKKTNNYKGKNYWRSRVDSSDWVHCISNYKIELYVLNESISDILNSYPIR